MAGRIDFFDDPAAPKANGVVPSANVVVVNDSGEVLMIRRADNDNWALPGGAMDLGESLPAAAIRETVEETGIQVEITGLVGIYTDPRHVILYTSNGEVRQRVSQWCSPPSARFAGLHPETFPRSPWIAQCACASTIALPLRAASSSGRTERVRAFRARLGCLYSDISSKSREPPNSEEVADKPRASYH